MEHCVAVTRTAHIVTTIVALTLASVAAPMPSHAAADERRAVLIVSAASPVMALDAHDARLLFLGHTVRVAGRTLTPMRNLSHPQLEQAFLQNLVAMSATGYDRYVLRLALQQGRPRPREYTDLDTLFEVLAADPLAVTYTWYTDLRGDSRFRVVRVVWRE